MRILYFADIRFPLERANGIQTMETCHALARRGHQVDLVVRPDTQNPRRDPFAYYDLPRIDRIAVEYAPLTGPAAARRLGYLAFAAGRALGTGRADVVLTRDLGVAAMLLRLPRRVRPPVVYESHGFAPAVAAALPELVATAAPPSASKLSRLQRRERRVWHYAEGYVTITAGLMQEMTARFGPRSLVEVVPDGTRLPEQPPAPARAHRMVRLKPDTTLSESEGVRLKPDTTSAESERVWPKPDTTLSEWERVRQPDTTLAASERKSNESSRAERAPVVAYAGHLYAWKGVDVLLGALARLPHVRGLIVGGHGAEPDLQRLRDRAAALGIADRVTFTGLVPPRRVAELLADADVLVLPNTASVISTKFTSPLKMFEYMAARRPIIASDLPAIREVLEGGVTAVLVPPGDAAAMAGAVQRLIEDRDLAAKLSAAAWEAVAAYTWDRRAGRLERLLQQVTRTA